MNEPTDESAPPEAAGRRGFVEDLPGATDEGTSRSSGRPDGRSTSPAGQELTRDQRDAEILRLYREAYALSPANIAVALRLGVHHEAQHEYLDALQIYVTHANQWNRVFEIRYRLAATLGMSDGWLASVADSAHPVRRRLGTAMAARASLAQKRRSFAAYDAGADAVEDPTFHRLNRALLEAARDEWANIARDLSVPAVLVRIFQAVLGRDDQLRDAAYQRQLLSRSVRATMIPSIQAARAVTEIQLLAPWPTPLWPSAKDVADPEIPAWDHERRIRVELRRQARRPKLAPEARYALACAYSRLWKVRPRPQYVTESVALLRETVARGDSSDWLRQIGHDPDLAPLRTTGAFHDWWDDLHQDEPKWSVRLWALEIAAEAHRYWHLVSSFSYGGVAESFVPGHGSWHGGWQTALGAADDRLYSALLDYLAPDRGERSTGLTAMERAAVVRVEASALAIRADDPPAMPDLRNRAPFANLDRAPLPGDDLAAAQQRVRRWVGLWDLLDDASAHFSL